MFKLEPDIYFHYQPKTKTRTDNHLKSFNIILITDEVHGFVLACMKLFDFLHVSISLNLI